MLPGVPFVSLLSTCHRGARRLARRRWISVPLLLLALLWLADRLFPLPLPADDRARVVLAEDGTPLWRFADADGVWRGCVDGCVLYGVTHWAMPEGPQC